jgi:cellulose synthase (UDP-forming)
MHIVFPLWHRKTYGIEAASVKLVYGWAHLFALIDRITNNAMEWHPTGAVHKSKNNKYDLFRAGVIVFNLIPAIVWIIAAAYYVLTWSMLDFTPILILGMYYFFTVIKVVLYKDATHNKKSHPDAGVLHGERSLEVAA